MGLRSTEPRLKCRIVKTAAERRTSRVPMVPWEFERSLTAVGVALPRIVAASTQDQIESATMRTWSNPPAQRPNITSLEDLSRGTERESAI